MEESTFIWFCGILLLNIYSSAAQNPLLSNKINGAALTPTLITTGGFTVEWDEADYEGSTGKFTITVDGPEGNLCEVQHDCMGDPLCTFKNHDDGSCGFIIAAKLVPCTDINVTVARGENEQSVAFNLAPDIKDAIVPQLSVDGNKATLSWTNSLTGNGGDITCATRAKATLQVGAGSEWVDGPDLDVILDAPSSQDWTLDDCQQGDLKGKVVYLTKTGDFPTFQEYLDNDNQNFQGVGATNLIVDASGDSCSLGITWEMGCSEVNYTVTCGEEEHPDVTDTSYTCTELTAGSQTVKVQAYLIGGAAIGGTESISEKVALTAPGAPVVKRLEGNDESVTELTVTWDKSTPSACAGAVTGYTITTSPDSTPVDVDAEVITQELTGLTACTEYTVSLAAKWSEGTVESGTKTAKTGSQAPGKPTGVTSDSAESTEIELSWTAPVNSNSCPITSYTVTWSPGNDNGTTEDESTTTTYTITGISPRTNYTITVKSNTEDDKSAVSEEYFHNDAPIKTVSMTLFITVVFSMLSLF